jgi:hypothetical protein
MSTHDDIPPSPAKAMALMVTLGVIACGAAALAFSFAVRYLNATHAGPIAETAAILLYGAVVVGIATWLAKVGQRAMKMTPSAAAKRYRRRFLIAMGLYVLTLTGAIEAYRLASLHFEGPLAYGLAVLPALPLMAAIAAMGFYLKEETDEFERAIQAESALWATGGLLAIATVWGFLEMFGLVPHVESWVAFPAWAIFLAPAQVIARRRYR